MHTTFFSILIPFPCTGEGTSSRWQPGHLFMRFIKGQSVFSENPNVPLFYQVHFLLTILASLKTTLIRLQVMMSIIIINDLSSKWGLCQSVHFKLYAIWEIRKCGSNQQVYIWIKKRSFHILKRWEDGSWNKSSESHSLEI